MSVVA